MHWSVIIYGVDSCFTGKWFSVIATCFPPAESVLLAAMKTTAIHPLRYEHTTYCKCHNNDYETTAKWVMPDYSKTNDILADFGTLILLLETFVLCVFDEKLIRYIAFESWQLMLN